MDDRPDLNEILGAESPEAFFAGRKKLEEMEVRQVVHKMAEQVCEHIGYFQGVTDGWIENTEDPSALRAFCRVRDDMEWDKLAVRLMASLAARHLEHLDASDTPTKEANDE